MGMIPKVFKTHNLQIKFIKNKVLDFSSQNLNRPSTNFASNITKCIILAGQIDSHTILCTKLSKD